LYRTHEMRKVRTEESGREEWACPTCGRRMMLRWPPHYEKTVVEAGDERACHVGSAPAETGTPAEQPGSSQVDVLSMNSARRWLRETGLDALSDPVQARLDPSKAG
jgi:hypothetical protein